MTDPGPEGYAYFEVDAGVGVRAWGADHPTALAQAALGVLALVIAPDGVREVEAREVRAQADTPEALLVNWINECLYVHEIEGFAVRRVEVDHLAGGLVHGVLHGEPIDLARHAPGTAVKAASPRRTAVMEAPTRVEVQVVVDV
jgi:SHS2 domain-containing protein